MCLLASLLLTACASTIIENPVPANLADVVTVPGTDKIRVWGDLSGSHAKEFIATEGPKLVEKYRSRIKSGQPLDAHFLALSGGADDGAFGAGLLVGWGQKGDRPAFDMVTGISSGALIAPLAFLGASHDRQLSEIFTHYTEEDIYQKQILAGVLGGTAVADNAPLARLIAKYIDAPTLKLIAEQRGQGRILLVGTTNLNAQRPVFWDMGKIAQMGNPQALDLFRTVLLASAALPGIFPPVEIKVQANGKNFTELHVDGGPTREVFLTPGEFSFKEIDKALGKRVNRKIWIIRNSKVAPEYSIVEPTALSIAARSLETLIKNQGIGDLLRIYQKARQDNLDFNLAVVPAEFSAPRPAPFARSYMTALYKEGFRLGKSGFPWAKTPPGFSETKTATR